MGIYSEKLIEEAKKSKIDTSKNDYSEVDNQIESVIAKLRDEYGIDTKSIQKSILHQIENNIEKFIDNNGNPIISGITSTVEVIVKESINEKKTNINEEKTRLDEKLDLEEKILKEQYLEKEYKSFDEMWAIEGDKIIDLFEGLSDELRKVNPEALGMEEKKAFARLWNVNRDDEKELEKALKEFVESDEVTPEEKDEILKRMKLGETPYSIIESYEKSHPELIKAIIDYKLAEIRNGKISKEDFIEHFAKRGYEEAYLIKIISTDFPEIKENCILLFEEAIELNVMNSTISIASNKINEIDRINNINELKEYCELHQKNYYEILELLGIENKDEETQVANIKEHLKRGFEDEKYKATRNKLKIIEFVNDRERFMRNHDFFKKLPEIQTQDELNELMNEYNLQDISFTIDQKNNGEKIIEIVEKLEDVFLEKKAEAMDGKEINLTADVTWQEFDKKSKENLVQQNGNEIMGYIGNLTQEVSKIPKASFEEVKYREVLSETYKKSSTSIQQEHYQLINKRKTKNEKEKSNQNETVDKEDNRKMDKKASFEATRKVAFLMKNELGKKRSLEEIIVLHEIEFDNFKKEYLEYVLNIEAKISDEDFEKMFMLKESLKEKDELYEELVDCNTEEEFYEKVRQLEIDIHDLKFGQDPADLVYTEEDYEKMCEINRIMSNVEMKEISNPDEEEIGETEEKEDDGEKVEENPNKEILIYSQKHIVEEGNALKQSIFLEKPYEQAGKKVEFEIKKGKNNSSTSKQLIEPIWGMSKKNSFINPHEKTFINNTGINNTGKVRKKSSKFDSGVKSNQNYRKKR